MTSSAILLAGIPCENRALYHRVRFGVGDPAAWLSIETDSKRQTVFIVRDIELDRAKQVVAADTFACPLDFAPEGGLSGDRATATAQAVAQCLRRSGVAKVTTDRTLPFVYAWHIQQAGLTLEYDPNLGVLERRSKDDQELKWLQQAQTVTEDAMQMACETVARASANSAGELQLDGSTLTSERVKKLISGYLLERDYLEPHGSIVATTPHTADCHERGAGPLKTGEPVIIDIFPQSRETSYCGDCTRTVVHGQVSDTVSRMHEAVVLAKQSAFDVARIGVEAERVHQAVVEQMQAHGFEFRRGEISDEPIMPHGTGHGIGLEVHEPILLDEKGGTLVANEVLTIEPGLYSRKFGGVRVEDMVVVGEQAPRNLNRLPEGLDWK